MSETLATLTGRDYVSYSSIDSYLQCGEAFRLRRIQNVPEDNAWYLAGGTAVHYGTEVADRYLHENPGQWARANVLGVEAFHGSMDEQIAEAGPDAVWKAGGRRSKAWPDGENLAWWRTSGPKMVADYLQWRQSSPLDLWSDGERFGVEIPVDYELIGGLPIKGYIDRLFITSGGEAYVVDIKTGSREPAGKLQLAIYALGIERLHGFRPRLGGYYMARTGQVPYAYDLDRYSDDLISRWARDFRKAVESQIFIPHPSPMCGSCSVNKFCYVYNSDVETPDFSSDL